MKVRVLAVGDPAVYAYTDEKLGLLKRCEGETGHEVGFDILAWADYGERVFQEADSDTPSYDVIMIPGHLWLPQFVEAKWLRPISPNGPLQAHSYRPDDIVPSVAEEVRYRGDQYLVPSFSDGHILFSHLGLDRITDPETGRGDVLRFKSIRSSDTRGRPRLVLKKAPSEIFLDWLPYFRSFGGEFICEDGSPGFHGTAGQQAAKYYRELSERVDPEMAPFGNEEIAVALRSGAVDFGVSWGGQAGEIVDPESRKTLSYATLTHPWNVTWSFAVLRKSERSAAAEEVLALLSDSHADKVVGRYAGSPSRRSSYRDTDLRKECPWFPAQEDLLDTARPLPSRADLPRLLGLISAALSDIVDHGAPIPERLSKAADEILGQ